MPSKRNVNNSSTSIKTNKMKKAKSVKTFFNCDEENLKYALIICLKMKKKLLQQANYIMFLRQFYIIDFIK